MLKIKNILIVAKSARMLARYTKNIAYDPLVIDCYSDVDTKQLAIECVCVNSLALKDVETAFNLLVNKYSISHVIYGSGLECHLSTLEFLEKKLTVLGNTLDVYQSAQNSVYFFLKLKKLEILYPDTLFQPPKEGCNWLIKPVQGEGGLEIKRMDGKGKASNLCYWQQYIAGVSMSVLFIATENDYKIIGFNKQLLTQVEGSEFIFSGVLSQLTVNNEIVKTISFWLDKLITEFDFKGINSLDFIVNDGCCYMLEINPRPSASMQLYADDILSEHIACFYTNKISQSIALKTYRAYKIIFAEKKMVLKNIKWPLWVVDIPEIASIIHIGMPICSIIAGGKNEQQVEDLLLSRQQQLMNLINR